jgi:hypothetical protein
MPTRFTFLKDVASMESKARQPVPVQFAEVSPSFRAEDIGWAYFEWLHSESEKCRESIIQQVADAVNDLNMATSAKDLGLSPKQYPFMLWRGTARATAVRDSADVALGEILEYKAQVNTRATTGLVPLQHCFVTALKRNTLVVQAAGKSEMDEAEFTLVKRCRGAGVFVPGPLKLEQRCRDKIMADYEGTEEWPPASAP